MKFWHALLIAVISMILGSFLGKFMAAEADEAQMLADHKQFKQSMLELKSSVDQLNDKFYQSEIRLK